MGLSYDVEVNYIEKGDLLGKQLGSATKSIKAEFGDIGSGLKKAFREAKDIAFEIGVAFSGAAAGFGVLVTGAMKFQSHMEDAQIAIADIIQVSGKATTFDQGMAVAATQIEKMRKDAAILPGEFEDLVDIYQMIGNPAMKAGMNPDQARKLASQVMAIGVGTYHMDRGTIGREVAALIEGQSGARNVFGRKLMGLSHDKASEFNHLSEAERLRLIQAELGKHDDSLKAYANTFTGLFTTARSNFKQVRAEFIAPVFESVKGALSRINNWYNENQPRVDAYAHYFGTKIAHAFDWAFDKFVEFAPKIYKIAEDVAIRAQEFWARIEPMVERIGKKLGKFMDDPKLIDKLETLGKLYVGMKIGAPLLGPAAKGLMSGMGIGTEGLAALAPIAPELLAAAGALAAAGLVLKDAAEAPGLLGKDNRENLADAGKNFSKAMGNIADQGEVAWNNLRTAMKNVEDQFGTFGTVAVRDLSDAALWASKHLNDLIPPLLPAGLSQLAYAAMNAGDGLMALHARMKEPHPLKRLDNGGGDVLSQATKDSIPNHSTNIQKVEIVVQPSQDPSRVARTIFAEIEKMVKNPKSGQPVGPKRG